MRTPGFRSTVCRQRHFQHYRNRRLYFFRRGTTPFRCLRSRRFLYGGTTIGLALVTLPIVIIGWLVFSLRNRMFLGVLFCLTIYFLPFGVGLIRNKRAKLTLFVLNSYRNLEAKLSPNQLTKNRF